MEENACCVVFYLCLLFKGVLVKRADGADEVFGREFARFIISPEGIEKFTFLCYNQFDILEFNGGKDALYNEIKSSEDIKNFLEKTNMLHDGYIIDAQYKYYGIEKTEDGLCFCPEEKKLTLRILVTSIFNTVVELEFENILDWQMKSDTDYIFSTFVDFMEPKRIVWSSAFFTNMDSIKNNSYVIAKSMKWRMVGEF